jgi:type IV pilus assembly protein PilY1
MNKRYPKKIISLAVSAGLSTVIASNAVLAADIDIYLEQPAQSVGPNILFVVDESGSMGWNAAGSSRPDNDPTQRMYQLKQAMRTLINDSSMDDVDVGIMGYRGSSIILTRHSDFITVGDGTNRTTLLNIIGDNHIGGSNTSSFVHSGNTPSSPALRRAMNWYRGTAPAGWNSPVDTDLWCKPNHIVFLTDGDPNTNGMSTYSGTNCHTNERVNNTWTNFQNTLSDNSGGRCSQTIAEWGYNHQPIGPQVWLNSKDNATDKQPKNVITHAIGMFVTPGSTREDYLIDISERSPDEDHPIGTYPNANYAGGYDTGDVDDPFTGGRYYPANNAAQMLNAFRAIVQSASATIPFTYTSPTIPFNVNNVATSGTEIYVPMFVPEAETLWKGNVKKYSISFNDNTNTLELKDQNSNDVVDSNLQFQTNVVDYWNSGTADGAQTLVGGAASKMTGSRNLYTYLGTQTDLTHADNRVIQSNGAITQAMLGAADATERNTLLYWANWLESDGTTARTGSMGAPLHSQPEVVRYTAANDLVLITTTEGILHAFDGETGQEVWSFMPDELLNTISAAAANVTATEPMYGLDGPMTYYEVGTNKYIVFGMRRGGRNYYALNITNRAAPSLAWEIIGGTTSGFTDLGQTWSKPIYTQMQIESSTVRDVLVFGGGYDDDQDDATTRSDDDIGNSIYIVNATTGALIREIDSSTMVNGDMGNGVAADILPIDINANGYTDRLYASDVGGRIIRVDIPDEALANITGTQDISGTVIADVSATGGADEFQRFFNTPEVAYYKRGGYTYLVLMIASGHRPKPLDDTVDDRFYAIRDFAVWRAPADGSDAGTDPDYAAVVDEGDLVNATPSPGTAASGSGWYIDLETSTGEKQKGFSKAKVYDYVVLFTTYSGSSTPAEECTGTSSTGVSHLYAINMIDGSAILQVSGSNFQQPTRALTNADRQVELDIPGLPPEPGLMFPDDAGKLGGKVVAVVGLTSPAQWPDRFHPISWEEVIDE